MKNKLFLLHFVRKKVGYLFNNVKLPEKWRTCWTWYKSFNLKSSQT